MPKENTHLWFSYGLLERIDNIPMLEAISTGLSRYLLGSIIPDTFYYTSDRKILDISEFIHGKDGSPTNATVLAVLDGMGDPEDLSFILGFITHCALDITFHPLVNALSGDYYDNDPARREEAVFKHRQTETCMDRMIGNDLRIFRLIRPSLLKGLTFTRIISSRFGVSEARLVSVLRRQLFLNALFTSAPVYKALRLLHILGIMHSKGMLGLFYPGINPGVCIPEPFTFFDPCSGKTITETLGLGFSRARTQALTMMEAAWSYRCGSMGREELMRVIPGRNLGTGENITPG